MNATDMMPLDMLPVRIDDQAGELAMVPDAQVPGWDLLPAGRLRLVRPGSDHLRCGEGPPWIIADGTGSIADAILATDIRFLGVPRPKIVTIPESPPCGPKKSAHMATSDAILFRRWTPQE